MTKGSTAVVVANILSYLCLISAFLLLLMYGLKYKGPGGKETWFNGYREQNMLGVFITLWCAVSYFAKTIDSLAPDDGFVPFTTLRYVDYCFTCPITMLDLLWNLDAPYKVTSALLVLTCLVHAVASFLAPPPASYAWFASGVALFSFTYYFILVIVRYRLDFFIECARDADAKNSIRYLKIGCFTFFGIWVLFPLMWVCGERGFGFVSSDLDHILHCLLDVITKNCYGFSLLFFKTYFDKKLLECGVDEDTFKDFSNVRRKEKSKKKKKKKKSSDSEESSSESSDDYSYGPKSPSIDSDAGRSHESAKSPARSARHNSSYRSSHHSSHHKHAYASDLPMKPHRKEKGQVKDTGTLMTKVRESMKKPKKKTISEHHHHHDPHYYHSNQSHRMSNDYSRRAGSDRGSEQSSPLARVGMGSLNDGRNLYPSLDTDVELGMLPRRTPKGPRSNDDGTTRREARDMGQSDYSDE